jgi:hypothetical protein
MARKVNLRRVWRWSSRIILGTIALVILLAAIAIGALHTKFGRERVRKEIEESLQEDFPGSTVGRVDGSPFGSLVVTGIAIAGKDGKPFITVESAELGVQIKPLLRRTVHVDTVTLHNVLVDLAAQPDPKPKKPAPVIAQPVKDKPSSWDIEVPSIVVRDARVLTKVGERLDGIDVDAGIRMHDGMIDATAAIKAAFRGQPFMAAASVRYGEALDANGGRRGEALDVPFAQVKLGPADVTVVSAHVVLDGPLAVDGTIIAHAPKSLAEELGAKDVPGDIALVVNSKDGDVAFDTTLAWAAPIEGTASRPATAASDTGTSSDKNPPPDIAASAPRTSSDGLANAVVGSAATTAALAESRTRVRGFAHFDVSKLDLAKTDFANLDAVRATGSALVAIDDPRGRATMALSGSADGVRGVIAGDGGYVLALIDGSIVDATGGALAAIDVQRKGDAWDLASALVSAKSEGKMDSPVIARKTKTTAKKSAGGITSKTAKKSMAGGTGSTTVALHGTLSPVLALDATGTVEANGVRYDETRVEKARVHFDAKDVTGNPVVASRVEVEGVKQGAMTIPSAEISANTALHEDGSIDVDLGEHRIVTSDGKVWTGRGGHVAVTEKTIDVKDLQTGTGNSTATASVKLGRLTDDISGKANVKNVSLAMLDPKLRGVVGGQLTFSQHAGRYTGKGAFDGKGIVIPAEPGQPAYPAIDGHVGLELAGRLVRVEASGTTAAGGGRVAFEVEGPRDITDPIAWKALERSSLRELTLSIDHLDASKLALSDPKDPKAQPVTGVVDGELTLTAADAKGSIRVSGITTKAGSVETTLSIKPGEHDAIDLHVDAALAGVKPATIDATVALPARPFDPDQWALLGTGALKHATIKAEAIAFDRALLARVGVERDLSGVVDARIDVDSAAAGATWKLDIANVKGPELRAPVAVHVEGGFDATGTTSAASAKMGNVGLTVDAKSPLTMAAAIAGKGATAGLDVTLTIPTTKATQILALLGRQDLTDGTVGGIVKVTGTVDKPNVVANLTAKNLTPPTTIATKKPAKMEQLDIAARWTGKHAELEVTGFETGGKLLKISGRGDVDKPSSVAATIEAAGFDIAPIVAFAPGALGAARGQLDGVIKVNGLDPQTGDVRGKLHLTEGRLPLAPTLGTLRKADVEITIAKQDVTAIISAKLGAGTITGKAGAKLAGGTPREADFDLAFRKISPIGAVQPVIDMDAFGKFAFADGKVNGKINLRKGKIYVPPEEGNELIDTGAPADMFFVGPDGAVIPKPKRKQAEKPWLFADIEVGTTSVYVDDPMVIFDGTASGMLHLEVGQGVTLTGSLATEKGAADVLGRRYLIDHAVVEFDGSYDPRLDIRLIHDFKTMALTVDIVGTSLVPDLRFKGDPANYTQGQLFSFFMGAEPSDDATGQGSQAVAGAASALLSSRLGRKVNKYLPFKLDTLNYEAGTATSSGAVRAGLRLSDKSHLIWRQRFEPRPDENPGEAVFEYIIKPWALVEATGGQRGGGGDILLRKRW